MTEPHTFCMISLGCAKNLVNSEQMLHLLQKAGYEYVNSPEGADVAVVNTCGFIDSAAEEAIDEILKLTDYKKNGMKIIVAGCMAQRYGHEVMEQLPEVDGVLGCGSYGDIAAAVDSALRGGRPELFGDINTGPAETPRVLSTPTYTAYLKIAEGCDNRCAYCVIPSLRGAYRSRAMEDILREARELAARGAKELIVIAQDITRYGRDIYGEPKLSELINKLCMIEGPEWLRLHYLYPDEIDDELIDTIASEPKVVKYLDIPIQHVSDVILKAMNRRGTKKDITELFAKLRRKIPGVVLRTSLICGLPGEGEQEFQELYDFLTEQRLERVGVFPFSPQEGTPAAEMPGQADEQTVAGRISRILCLQSDIMDEYNRAQTEKTLIVLCEGADPETGLFAGRSFADSPEIDGRVLFSSDFDAGPGDMLPVIIKASRDGDLLGKASEDSNSGLNRGGRIGNLNDNCQ